MLSETTLPKTTDDQLAAIIGMASMLTEKPLSEDDLKSWILACWNYLILDREGTIEDVRQAFDDHIAEQKWFPRIADLAPRVEAMVLRRREVELAAVAQAHAIPLPAGGAPEIDWSQVSTADLPPGYDYRHDPHWQRGLDLLVGMREGTETVTPLGAMILDLDRRRSQFQGASKERIVACPTCKGSRWLRGTGPDPVNVKVGESGSSFIKCPVCCPGGVYSHEAERTALRKSATRKAAV